MSAAEAPAGAGGPTADDRLLIAFDGSDDARNAIAWAGRLLAPRRALVVHSFVGLSQMLLHSGVRGLRGELTEAVEEFDAADVEDAEKLAAEGAALATAAGMQAEPLVVKQGGGAWRTLVDAAGRHRVAAIVAGARGRSKVASVLLCCVSTALLAPTPVPLLVVPTAADPQAEAGPVLLCYDASASATHAIDCAGDLLVPTTALVLNVWESWLAGVSMYMPGVGAAVGDMAGELDEMAAGRASECAEEGAARALAAGFDPQPLSRRCDGAVWRGVLDASEEAGASAIVVGARALHRVPALLGSVSRRVVHHAGRPVLLIPSGGAADGDEERITA